MMTYIAKGLFTFKQIIFPLKDWYIFPSSFNEEENIEERENGEENYFTETNSQDSCKENEAEAEEESREEKSVEE